MKNRGFCEWPGRDCGIARLRLYPAPACARQHHKQPLTLRTARCALRPCPAPSRADLGTCNLGTCEDTVIIAETRADCALIPATDDPTGARKASCERLADQGAAWGEDFYQTYCESGCVSTRCPPNKLNQRQALSNISFGVCRPDDGTWGVCAKSEGPAWTGGGVVYSCPAGAGCSVCRPPSLVAYPR